MLLRTSIMSGLRSLALVIAIVMPWSASSSEMEPTEIYDLRYGETLYHYFQKKYFSAITDLMVAEEKEPIKIQGEDPELLLGGLYLAYGMHNEAGKIFARILEENTDNAIKNRAYYYLAKIS